MPKPSSTSPLAIFVLSVTLSSFGRLCAQPITMQVIQGPTLVKIGERWAAYYELALTNVSTDTIKLTSLEVIDSKTRKNYLDLATNELERRIGLTTIDPPRKWRTCIAPGAQAFIYIEFFLDAPVAATIFHRLGILSGGANPIQASIVTGAATQFKTEPEIVLGNPLRGGPWCAVYDPSWERGHRRVIFTRGGIPHIPGRFAIDFIRLDEEGKYASGNVDSVQNWLGYGSDVLAVADGQIVSALDTFSESPTLSNHRAYLPDQATGNYIVLKLQDSQYVFYEHLKPGSIRVKVGQIVKRGDVIAALGYTGQTTGPHLHLHVADRNTPLGAEGLPFEFRNFELLGTYDDFGDFGKKEWSKPTNGNPQKKNQRPPPHAVLRFISFN